MKAAQIFKLYLYSDHGSLIYVIFNACKNNSHDQIIL